MAEVMKKIFLVQMLQKILASGLAIVDPKKVVLCVKGKRSFDMIS